MRNTVIEWMRQRWEWERRVVVAVTQRTFTGGTGGVLAVVVGFAALVYLYRSSTRTRYDVALGVVGALFVLAGLALLVGQIT